MPFLRAGKVAISERGDLDLVDHHRAAWSLAVTALTPEIGRVTPDQGGCMGRSPARVALLAGLLAIIGTLTSCSSTATHSQSPAPSISGSNTSNGGTTSSSKPPTPTTSADPLPTNFGTAQPAVTAFMNLDTASNKAFEDPQHVPSTTFDQFAVGSAKTLYDAALFNMKKAGEYYKGTPAQQRIRVASADLKSEPATVVLTSCPLASATDPFKAYYVATGKPVPAGPTPKVAPPYGKTIKVVRLSGSWMVENLTTDSTRTCTP
jgi:hypothetical protein